MGAWHNINGSGNHTVQAEAEERPADFSNSLTEEYLRDKDCCRVTGAVPHALTMRGNEYLDNNIGVIFWDPYWPIKPHQYICVKTFWGTCYYSRMQ